MRPRLTELFLIEKLPAGHVEFYLKLIRKHVKPGTGLFRVYDVIEQDGIPPDDIYQMAVDGVIELRPESGVGLIGPEEKEVVPKGPDGWPLTWGRIKQG